MSERGDWSREITTAVYDTPTCGGRPRRMTYVGHRRGRRGPLRGQTALVHNVRDDDRLVAAQFDNAERTGKGLGWWPFRKGEFA